AGNASITFDVPAMYANSGLLGANFFTTVFDETGRPVSRVTATDIYTQDIFHGIKDDGSSYYPLNSTIKFSLVSLNKDGAPVNATAKVTVIKHEYRTVLTRNGSYFRYDSQQEDKIISDKEIAVGDKTAYEFIPRSPGDYEIRVYRPGANVYVRKQFYSYGGWGGESTSFEVNNEGNVDIELDKEKYNAGDVAKLLFKTPFSGKMLVTVERDGVLSHQYLTVEKRTASMDLKLASEHVPNVYVTATLIKPHEATDMPLTVAHGFQNIMVEENGRKIPVQITAAKSVPQFSGEVRLMAVAFKDEKFGNAEAATTVADPIVISSSLPRFISPGDTVLLPVTISNTTAKTATGNATLNLAGPVKVVGSSSQNVTINANSEGRATFQIIADPNVAAAKITVTVNALGEKFTEETEIAVRPPSTLQKLSGSGSIAGGQTQRINIPQGDFMPGSFKYDLIVSRSPVAQVADQLRYLVTYPYGCTEQTVSAAFPQLYYGDFVDALKLNPENKQNAAYNVAEAIRKIKMRQLYNGAVTLWDGEGEADWWATTYAAHFLLEARKAGYDVDNSLLETMLSYLSNRLKTKETVNYYYNRNQQRKIAPKEVAYSLYVLSLANRPQASTMNYYKASGPLLALDSRYLLSAAYAVAGDKRSFNALLPSSFSGEESVQQTGGSYYSALRDEAIALNS
ncbi:MAG: hypothetical protein EON98_12920, partial [Chitinophagaceae bacterium]